MKSCLRIKDPADVISGDRPDLAVFKVSCLHSCLNRISPGFQSVQSRSVGHHVDRFICVIPGVMIIAAVIIKAKSITIIDIVTDQGLAEVLHPAVFIFPLCFNIEVETPVHVSLDRDRSGNLFIRPQLSASIADNDVGGITFLIIFISRIPAHPIGHICVLNRLKLSVALLLHESGDQRHFCTGRKLFVPCIRLCAAFLIELDCINETVHKDSSICSRAFLTAVGIDQICLDLQFHIVGVFFGKQDDRTALRILCIVPEFAALRRPIEVPVKLLIDDPLIDAVAAHFIAHLVIRSIYTVAISGIPVVFFRIDLREYTDRTAGLKPVTARFGFQAHVDPSAAYDDTEVFLFLISDIRTIAVTLNPQIHMHIGLAAAHRPEQPAVLFFGHIDCVTGIKLVLRHIKLNTRNCIAAFSSIREP